GILDRNWLFRKGILRQRAFQYRARRSLFASELQRQVDVTAGVVAGNLVRAGSHLAVLGVDFVIHVRVEAAEVVFTFIVSKICPHGLRFGVEQVNDAGRRGIIVLIDNLAVNRAELGTLGISRYGKQCTTDDQRRGERIAIGP